MENTNAVDDALNRNAQADRDKIQRDIAEARQNLSHLEMKDINTIGPPPAPMAAPNPKDLDKIQPSQETVENIGLVQGGQIRNENAVDQALARSDNQEQQRPDRQQNIER